MRLRPRTSLEIYPEEVQPARPADFYAVRTTQLFDRTSSSETASGQL